MRFTQGTVLQRRQEFHHSRESPRYILALEKGPVILKMAVLLSMNPLLEAVREVVGLAKDVLRIKLLDRPARHSILLGFQKSRRKTQIEGSHLKVSPEMI